LKALFDLHQPARATALSWLVDDDGVLDTATLFKHSQAVARGLSEQGVRSGDRVAIWLPNHAAWLISFLACAQIGAMAVSVNTRFRSVELADLLQRSASKLLIYWPEYKGVDFSDILAACSSASLVKLEKLVLYSKDNKNLPDAVTGKPVISFSALLGMTPLEENAGTPESPCIIFTTSGTTRSPKLVVHNQRNVLRHAVNVARQYGLTSADRFLLLPPFCGVFGFCAAMAALAASTPLIMSATWNANAFSELIDRHGITHLVGSNEALAQLFDARAPNPRFPTVKFMASANLNPAHANVSERGAQCGIPIVGLYGSSEMQALFSLGDRNASWKIGGRAGGMPASSSVRVRARDPQSGVLCKPGVPGELEMLAPDSRFVEYLDDTHATRKAFTADEYFKTGDLGFVDDHGGFVYLARMGDSLRLGGFMVSAAEIEELIQEHAAVLACQVVAVQTGGAERPVAFVIPRHGSDLDSDELIGYVAERVARYKVPVRIFVVEEFPTIQGANGAKVQKNKLRELAESRMSNVSEVP